MDYITGTNKIVYRSVGFSVGLTITGYFWNPSNVKSSLQTFTEVAEGLYYCNFDFDITGTWMGLFYENAVVKASAVFKVKEAAATSSAVAAVSAAVGALNDISTSDVNAEIVDALATDTYAEPGKETPASTTSLSAKISYLYKEWRNKKQLSKLTKKQLLYNDAGDTVDQERDVDDDGNVFTKSEIIEGT